MNIDPLETKQTAEESLAETRENAASRLSTLVAITIALLATFMGVCKVKDDNIVQAMHQKQAQALDDWAFYQARNIREEIARSTVTQLELAASSAPASMQEKYNQKIAEYRKLVENQSQKKADHKASAEKAQIDYDALNFRDDQFDLSDALLAIAIALLAMTALTHKRWLYFLALFPTAGGVVMGLAGLLEWRIHWDALSRLLS